MVGFLLKRLRSIDIYGPTVPLTHNGSSTYKTLFGGFLSLIAFLLLVLFIILLGINQRQSITTTSTTTVVQVAAPPVASNPISWTSKKMSQKTNNYYSPYYDSTHFNISPYWAYATGFSRPYDETFFIVENFLHIKRPDGTYEYIYVPNKPCDNTIIQMKNQTLYNSFDFSSFICPNLTSIEIWSDDWGNDYQTMEVWISKCSGLTTCQSSTNITSYITGFTTHFLTLNTYYDESDPVNPIKQYFDYHKYINHASNFREDLQVNIQGTEITFLNGTKQTIYETGTIYSDVQSFSSKYLAKITMFLSPKRYKIQEYTLYSPQNVTRMLDSSSAPGTTQQEIKETKDKKDDIILTIFKTCAEIGGFMYFINIILGTVARYFTNTLMKMSFINAFNKSKIKQDRAELYAYKVEEKKEEKPNLTKNYTQLEEIQENKNNAFSQYERNDQESSQNITYSFKDLLYTLLCCFKCKCKRSSGGRAHSLNERYQRFKQDCENLNIIMDATAMVATINELKQALAIIKSQFAMNDREIQAPRNLKSAENCDQNDAKLKSQPITPNIGYPVIVNNIVNVQNVSEASRKERYEITKDYKEYERSQSNVKLNKSKDFSNKDNYEDIKDASFKMEAKSIQSITHKEMENMVEMSNQENIYESMDKSKNLQNMERSFCINDESLEAQNLYKVKVVENQNNSNYYQDEDVFKDEED